MSRKNVSSINKIRLRNKLSTLKMQTLISFSFFLCRLFSWACHAFSLARSNFRRFLRKILCCLLTEILTDSESSSLLSSAKNVSVIIQAASALGLPSSSAESFPEVSVQPEAKDPKKKDTPYVSFFSWYFLFLRAFWRKKIGCCLLKSPRFNLSNCQKIRQIFPIKEISK